MTISTKWHVKPDGKVSVCSATKRACRYSETIPGSTDSHFGNKADAEAAAAKLFNSKFGGLMSPPLSKTKINLTVDKIVAKGDLDPKHTDALRKLSGLSTVSLYSDLNTPMHGISSVDLVTDDELVLPESVRRFLSSRSND